MTSSMASILPNSAFHFFFTISILFSSSFIATTHISADKDENNSFVKAINPKSLNLRKEKLSHFRFYWHDIQSGKNPTSITVIKPLNFTTTGFGMVNMIDNPLTISPKLNSKTVGKAQGFYASASQEELGLLMTMNFSFIEGKYNGSTITVLGRNPVFDKVREMAVVGGSGLFRFARGYAQATTHSSDFRTGGYAVVQCNVYVMHY